MATGKGNRGEWGEPYVALYLLGTGRLYMSDENGVKKPNEWMNVIEVLRQETLERLVVYHYNAETTIVDIRLDGELVAQVPAKRFLDAANRLADEVITSKGHSFAVSDEVMSFIRVEAYMEHLKAKSVEKSDIFLTVSDPRTSVTREHIGFSIKTKFGHNPTLFNTAKASGAVYKIDGMTLQLQEEINSMVDAKGHAAIMGRCQKLKDNCKLTFVGYPVASRAGCSAFYENLDHLNPRLPVVIERMLWYHFFEEVDDVSLEGMSTLLIKKNPCGITIPETKYPYMIKQFLYAAYCGMTASTLWNGKGQVNGGFISVSSTGEVLGNYAMESEDFKGYLYKNCYLDFPSTSEGHGDYAKVYEKNGEYFFNLNFEIRYR